MNRARRAVRAAFALSVSLCLARPAHAGGSTVVVVSAESADAVVRRAETRLAAELRAAGFEVETRTVERTEEARKLVEEPQPEAPFATILLVRAGTDAATDVWIADHVTHKTVVRRVTSPHARSGRERALALQVVELLRASLLEAAALAPAAPDPEEHPAPPPPRDVAAWTRAAMRRDPSLAPSRVRVGLGVAGLWSAGVGPAVAPALSVTFSLSETWAFGLIAAAPAFGGHVTDAEGDATVRQELGLVEITWAPIIAGAARVHIAAGGGAAHVQATGYGSSPYVGASDGATAGLVEAGVGIGLRLGARAALRLDVRELVALPRPVLAFAGRQVTPMLRPGTLAAFALEVDL